MYKKIFSHKSLTINEPIDSNIDTKKLTITASMSVSNAIVISLKFSNRTYKL